MCYTCDFQSEASADSKLMDGSRDPSKKAKNRIVMKMSSLCHLFLCVTLKRRRGLVKLSATRETLGHRRGRMYLMWQNRAGSIISILGPVLELNFPLYPFRHLNVTKKTATG